MKKYKCLVVLLLLVQLGKAQEGSLEVETTSPFVLGKTIEVYSKQLKEYRKLNVYFPNGYREDRVSNYPVIYLLDGSAEEDFIHIAGLLQFANYPWVNYAPQAILIGIENVDRKRDFTFPTRNIEDKKDFPTTGGSVSFMNFLEYELQPFVKEHYSQNDTSIIIGQSLGGLLATEILLKRPFLFSHYIIVSPSLWWDDESLLKGKPQSLKDEKKVYIAVGEEGEVMERTAKELVEKLAHDTQKCTVNIDHIEQHNHANILHLAVYKGFRKMFSSKDK
ncbi:MAG: alpha/beta hydrolase-fold protein [Flavipsychrobacter sp.]